MPCFFFLSVPEERGPLPIIIGIEIPFSHRRELYGETAGKKDIILSLQVSFVFILFLQIYIYRIIILFLQYYLYLHLSVHVIRNE